jgi:hypothetical protein
MSEPSLEDFFHAILLQNQRIYDVLLLILADSNEEAYKNIVELHTRFEKIGPWPFAEGEDE